MANENENENVVVMSPAAVRLTHTGRKGKS